MVTCSGDSVMYMPTVTEPEPLLDHQGGVFPHNRWQRSQLFGSIVGFHPLTLLDRILEAKTRLAQTSWARPGWVGSCDRLACPSAQDSLQDLAKTFGGISGILLGFYNLECLGLCVASKTKSLGVKGMGNVSIVMLS